MSQKSQTDIIDSLKAEIAMLKARCEKAEAAEKNLLDALKISPMALCHHDKQLRYTWLYNGHMGLVQDDVIGKTDWDILDKDLADRMGAIKRRVLETGIGERAEIPTAPGKADSEYFDLVVEPVKDEQIGEIIGLTCTGIDVTHDRRQREEHRESNEDLKFIFAASPLPITVTDIADGYHLFYNDAADEMFLINERVDRGIESSLFSHFNFPQSICDHLAEGKQIESHRFEYRKEGQTLHLSLNAKQIFYNNKAAILATFTDLTLQIKQQYRLEDAKSKAERLAHTDVMTGLDNRRSLFIKAEQILKFLNRNDDDLCAIVIDIDYFKKINDTWGHPAGDQVIESLGELLKESIRHSDIAARYGGEEFAIILPNTALNSAMQFAEKLRQSIEKIQVEVGEKNISISASFGVASYSAKMSGISDLLHAADIALYKAKKTGRNCVKCIL